MADLTPHQKLHLITKDLQEVMSRNLIEDIVLTEQRPLKIYWGTAITGKPHAAYFVPMIKLAQFLRADCAVTILLADIHGTMDADKTDLAQLGPRTEYYRFVITNMLSAIGVPLTKLRIVTGSTFQDTLPYYRDLMRIIAHTTQRNANKAGSDVVKQLDDAPMKGMVYPLMQALDEDHLDVDAQFGGVDQRKIFTYAAETLPKLGKRKRAHLMNPMVPGLTGGKMSSSEPESKVDVLDGPEAVAKKIRKAVAEPKKVEGNGLLAFARYVLLPASELRLGNARLVVERVREEKEPLVYSSIEEMEQDYSNDVLTPQLLKQAVTKALNELLEPVQRAYMESEEAQEITRKAYPEVGKEKPAKDKKKDKGGKKRGAGKEDGTKEETKDKTREGTKEDEKGEAKDQKSATNGVDLPIRTKE